MDELFEEAIVCSGIFLSGVVGVEVNVAIVLDVVVVEANELVYGDDNIYVFDKYRHPRTAAPITANPDKVYTAIFIHDDERSTLFPQTPQKLLPLSNGLPHFWHLTGRNLQVYDYDFIQR